MSGLTLASVGKRLSMAEFKMLLLEHIARRRPLSVIRFNDGEGKLVGAGTQYSHAELMQMLDRWFCDNRLTLDQLRRLQARVSEATRNADVIGCPDEDWPEEFAKANSVLADVGRSALPGRPLSTVLVNFPQAMLLDGFFKTFLDRIGFLGLVTSRDVGGIVRHLFEPAEIAWYRVPEQAIYAYQPDLPRHFPESFDFLCSRIEVPFTGAVFLVGAGPCGKVYCDVIKRRGGIAIDIGSVFDVWAGRLTRPEMSFNAVRHYYERVVSVPSPRFDDVLALAEIHQNAGDLGRSSDLLRMTLRLHPGSASLALKSAECLLLLGDPVSARGVYERLVQPGGFGVGGMRAFARLFMRFENPDYAGEILVQALYEDPADPLTLRMALSIFTHAGRQVRGQKAGFREDLLSAAMLAAASCPEDHALLFDLARFLGSAGKVKEAAAWGLRAVDLFPVQPAYYQPAIDWLMYLGDHEQAARLGERLAQLDRNGAESRD